ALAGGSPTRRRRAPTPRRNSVRIVPSTNAQSEMAVSTYHWVRPASATLAPVAIPITAGPAKVCARLRGDERRQAINGPTPIRKIRARASGALTLLKKGGPTVILTPRTASEITGKIVPQKTANAIPTSTRLLKRKAASRERYDSNSAGVCSSLTRLISSAL